MAVGPKGHAIASGQRRVLQTLSTALREPVGSDRFHPMWGSTLHDFIGTAASLPFPVGTLVQSEVQRVVELWAKGQFLQFQRNVEKPVEQRANYVASEVVTGIDSPETRVGLDRVAVKVTLQTLSGEQMTVVQSMGA